MNIRRFNNSDILVCWVGNSTDYAFAHTPGFDEEAILNAFVEAYGKYECDTSVIVYSKGANAAERHARDFAQKIASRNPQQKTLALPSDSFQKQLGANCFITLFCVSANPPEWLEKSTNIIASVFSGTVDTFSDLNTDDPNETWSIEGFIDSIELRKQLSELKTVLTAPDSYNLPQCVLLTGETGVGKSRLAEILAHKALPQKPYKHINCASLHPELADTILFGSVKGAFTGFRWRLSPLSRCSLPEHCLSRACVWSAPCWQRSGCLCCESLLCCLSSAAHSGLSGPLSEGRVRLFCRMGLGALDKRSGIYVTTGIGTSEKISG